MTVEAELQRGLGFHRTGDLAAAAACYRAVLDADPDNVDALHLMSALAMAAGEAEFAATLAQRAVQLAPDFAPAYVSLGNALQAGARLEEAAGAFQQAIALQPQSAEAHCNLSNVLYEMGRPDEAVNAAVEAVVLAPDMAEAHNNLGNALLALGSADEAAESYGKATALAPSFAQAWANLASAEAELARLDKSIDHYCEALSLSERPEWRFDLGNVLAKAGLPAEAAEQYGLAIAGDPVASSPYINLSNLLIEQDQVAPAIAVLRAGLEQSDDPELHWNLALALLRNGDYAEGWREYEWRWRLNQFQPLLRDFGKPEWDGSPLAGRTLLVHVEQGFGDAILAARFLARAAEGGKVVVECRPELKRLLGAVEGVAQVVAAGEELPAFDVHLPMMSLPLRLGVTLDTLPGRRPYLSVPVGAAEFSDIDGGVLRVGIAWSGSPTRRDNAARSVALAALARALVMDGCRLYSLQVGPAAAELAAEAPAVVDLSGRLGDFADTAAAIDRLDLVITVDTAIAHLAGALGKPVWVLLAQPNNAFLWMVGRADSPWYPTARLFRQPDPGAWEPVLDQVSEALQGELVKNSSRR
ncbi:MAG: tetratricopeptide repeat protein [Solirubrobacterales bacterium]